MGAEVLTPHRALIIGGRRHGTYELVEIDIMQGAHKTPEHLARHPFGRVPAFEHDGFKLYETSAITRYLDAVLPGPAPTPRRIPKARRGCSRQSPWSMPTPMAR
jgi:glutathione S-transferase